MADLVILAALLFWLSGLAIGWWLAERSAGREVRRLEARWRSVFPEVER